MPQQHIHERLHFRVCWRLTDEQRPKWMILWKTVFIRFDDPWRRDRARYKCNSDRLKGFRRQALGGKSCPEAMPVSRDCCKTCDAVIANEVVDFAALRVSSAVIPGPVVRIETGKSSSRPWFG